MILFYELIKISQEKKTLSRLFLIVQFPCISEDKSRKESNFFRGKPLG